MSETNRTDTLRRDVGLWWDQRDKWLFIQAAIIFIGMTGNRVRFHDYPIVDAMLYGAAYAVVLSAFLLTIRFAARRYMGMI